MIDAASHPSDDHVDADGIPSDALEPLPAASEGPAGEGEDEDAWPAGDLESAYRQALEANESVEWDFGHFAEGAAAAAHPPDASPDGTAEASPGAAVDGTTAAEGGAAGDSVRPADRSSAAPAGEGDAAGIEPESPVTRIRMNQVIEAALFVGGEPLTSKRLCYMLKGDYDLDAIEQAIDELNRRYIDENRPYEIRLGEGGYRIVLREEFDSVRNRVFGIGPREVKLSQDVLEVLALVAYRQPVTQQEIEALGKTSPGGALRQLLRRQLISLERDEQDRKRVTYSTTARFLSVFGIGSIDELPQADELAFK